MTKSDAEALVDRFQDAVVDREHAQTMYRRGADLELNEARAALMAALCDPKQEGGR